MPPRSIYYGIGPILLAIGLFCLPGDSLAHGVGSKLETDCRTAVLFFQYSSGEPLAYAETLVFSPEDPKVEYQNGRTDRAGRFAFSPNVKGSWRIVVSDGRGHQVTARVDVETLDKAWPPSQDKSTAEMNSAGCPVLLKALLGMSLIFNLGLIIHFFQLRRRIKP